MGEVKSINGGEVEVEELGDCMIVYFDESGEPMPLWTDGLSEPQLALGAMALMNAVTIHCFWDTDDE
jgi:hypothetical protein